MRVLGHGLNSHRELAAAAKFNRQQYSIEIGFGQGRPVRPGAWRRHSIARGVSPRVDAPKFTEPQQGSAAIPSRRHRHRK